MRPLTILTNDPSITAWGWAVIQNGKIMEQGCIKTEPEHKKKRIRKSDDTVRRISEVNQALIDVISRHTVDYILSEAPHGSQSATAAVMIGMVTAIAQTFSDLLEIPIEWYSEEDAKRCVLDKRSATKDEMIEKIGKLYQVRWTGVKYRDEAVADAIAIYHVATKESTTLKLYQNVSH